MTNILISGASIAGTATAYWLRRHGFTPTVVERAPALREGGYKVDIRGVALDVIERMGLLDAVRARSTDMRIATHYDGKGRRIAEMDADLFGGRAGTDAEIMRGDLNELLYDLTRDDVEYIFDDSITGISEDGTVTFERSAPRRFDLVVGADGVHSNTRRLAFGEESAFVRDLGYYISICTVPNRLGLDREEAVHAAPGRTANVYSTRQDTNAKALFMWSSQPLAYDHRDLAQQKELLAQAMAGVEWEVPELLEAVRGSSDFYFDSVSQIHMDRWSKGRVVLVGDAAYCASPASGQGTSLALVGAYVLAGELASGGGADGYERELRAFVDANQKLGPANVKGMVLPSRAAIWFQTRMIRLLPHLPGRDKMIDRVAGPMARAATAITLKAYME
ncbi:FAD-dependent monooxygenase [Nonomuraea guangzhouensis]|uniref:FAD-dependent monooxygenase n=1 Tax=Nonomuraea guangzhouensis TaxID=1291555 RepID=A0ABW4GQR6_9ACTN|nr:FAD-dependent monooxygenase [Nonomuraea guangzhouensis]